LAPDTEEHLQRESKKAVNNLPEKVKPMSQACIAMGPQSWGTVIGQDPYVQTLRNAISAERVAAYLFGGAGTVRRPPHACCQGS